MTSPFYEKYSYSYSNYLQSISEINLVVFENECRKLAAHELNDLNIDLSSNENPHYLPKRLSLIIIPIV